MSLQVERKHMSANGSLIALSQGERHRGGLRRGFSQRPEGASIIVPKPAAIRPLWGANAVNIDWLDPLRSRGY